jgi:hypothetical protein
MPRRIRGEWQSLLYSIQRQHSTPEVAKLGYFAKKKPKLHGLSPRANNTDRATAACRRSDCQLLRTEGATWSV